MRFFIIACVFCVFIASLGCMTNNWSKSAFSNKTNSSQLEFEDVDESEEAKPSFWKTQFGNSSGIDPRAREIEKRLGY